MNAAVVGVIVFACTFGGALLGMWLRAALPDHLVDGDSKDTIKVGVGLIATMTALVLGLVTASAKTSYDSVDSAIKQTAVQLLTLDRTLARIGPETGDIRRGLQRTVGARIDSIWPTESSLHANLDPLRAHTGSHVEALADAMRALKPKDDAQRALQARAIDLTESMLQERWLTLAGTENSIPRPFLGILLFWLTLTFASFGLFAPRNAMVVIVLLLCAASVASAVFLVLELDTPFDGLLKVSAEPLRHALSIMGR